MPAILKYGGKLYKTTAGWLGLSDPPAYTLALSGPGTVTEGEDANATFTITLSDTAPAKVTIGYATVAGSAIAGTHYTHTEGTAEIAQGQTQTTVDVPILDDSDVAISRTFALSLTSATMEGHGSLTLPANVSVTIEDDDAEPGTSPLANGDHPRIFIVGGDYAEQDGAITLSDLRSNIVTYHSARFQAHINYANNSSRFSANLSSQDINDMAHQMFTYALFAILDPAELDSFSWGGKTQADYVTAAKNRLLKISERDHRVLFEDSTVDDDPRTVMSAATYDWLMAIDPDTFDDEDRQYLAEGAVRAYCRRSIVGGISGPTWTEGAQKGLVRGSVFALALAGDAITGSPSYTGTTSFPYPQAGNETYEEAMTRLATTAFEEHAAMCARADSDFGNRGGFPDGFLYGDQSVRALALALAAISSAYGINMASTYHWTRKYPYYWFQSIHRAGYTTGSPTRGSVLHKQSSMFEQSPSTTPLAALVHFLGDAEPAAYSAYNWWRQSVTTGVSTGSARFTEHYPLYHYLFGWAEKPTGAPPHEQEDFATMNEYAAGEYCFRSSNEYSTNSAIVWFWAIDRWLGGHQQPLYGWIEAHRAGQLLVHGGTHKTYSSAPVNSIGKSKAGDPQTDSSQFRIYRDGESTTSLGWRVAGGSNTSLCTHVSDLVEGKYGYVKYTQTPYWGSKASFHQRTVVFSQPQNGGEPYFVVLDKATIPDAETHIPFQAWKVSFKPEILDGASKTLLDGPDTGSASNPDTDGESGEYQTTTGQWRVVNNKDGGNGVLYATSLYPESRDVRLVGGDFNWCARDYTLTPAGSRLDTNRDAEQFYVSNKHVPSNDDRDGNMTYARDEAARWFGRWRVEIRDADPGTQQKFLTVFHLGLADTHTTATDVSLVEAFEGTMEGAIIEDPSRWRVILFPTDHENATVSTAFSYHVPDLTGTAHHVITGLTPNESYDVFRDDDTFTITPGTGDYTSTAAGVLEVTL